MAKLGHTIRLIATGAVSIGVAAIALWSGAHAFHKAARIETEKRYLAAMVAAMLDPQQARPAAPAALDPPAVRLARRPLDRNALSQVALEDALAGRRDAARPIMQEVVRRDPRATSARVWLMTDALGRNDLATAVSQIERLMSVDVGQRSAYFPILAEIARQPRAERPLMAALASGVSWRTEFLGYLTTRGVDPARIFRLSAGTAGKAASAGDSAQGGLILQLIARGDYDGAYLAWVNFLPPDALAKVASVYDGSFVGLPGPKPFNWSFNDGDAASVGIDRGSGLRIEYSGGQSARLASQTILLKPGSYTLDYFAKGSGEVADGGTLGWHLLCLPSSKPVLDLPIAGLGDSVTGHSARFVVPNDCNAQLLSIEATLGTFPQSRSVTIARVEIRKVS
ncbi:MAG: hypothetical protein WC804_04675 [Sphingomonas sp.]|jgi:hypothetical protein|uniref:tetratricopeptide repeat protein n=1 Tax=Sphingomonas sp. TaxID=28214 RepID=UPI003569E873